MAFKVFSAEVLRKGADEVVSIPARLEQARKLSRAPARAVLWCLPFPHTLDGDDDDGELEEPVLHCLQGNVSVFAPVASTTVHSHACVGVYDRENRVVPCTSTLCGSVWSFGGGRTSVAVAVLVQGS